MQRITVRLTIVSFVILLTSFNLALSGRPQEQENEASLLVPVRVNGKWATSTGQEASLLPRSSVTPRHLRQVWRWS